VPACGERHPSIAKPARKVDPNGLRLTGNAETDTDTYIELRAVPDLGLQRMPHSSDVAKERNIEAGRAPSESGCLQL
jgi:hypothetical protein